MTVLAIDLRGHGESTKQGDKTLDFRSFTDQEHQASIKDVEAAVDFLKSKSITTIYTAGASIGANLALQYQAEHPEVRKSVLLSPGTNYKGLLTEPLAKKLAPDQKVYLAAGTQDIRSYGSAVDMANAIASLIKGEKKIKIYRTAAHGTDLFAEDPEFIDELTSWLTSG